ncbi:MAG: glycine--tRNA ligase subunit beta [Candidatus Obscuribacterales bacterium]|nr:glycine--tRNA ligase subunit beta [Candidatus Obscuribacterales bacterium]
MSNYLLEVGVEELPAGFVPEAMERLGNFLKTELNENHIEFGGITTLATPRRLTAIIKDIAPEQKTTSKRVKGPPLKNSFDESGKPLGSATGFASRNGVKVEELERETVGGIEYLFATVVNQGRPIAQVLPQIIEKVIGQISGERLMRWGNSTMKFSRPLRWFVSLLDDQVVPFNIAGIESGRNSIGHRILKPETVEIKDVDSYEATLEKAFVMVDQNKRREKIVAEVKARASELNGYAMRLELNESLVDEVVYLTEWPKAVVGDLEAEYLALPSMLIETIMVHHQRYFPVSKLEKVNEEEIDHKLLPHFITISNNDRENAKAKIKQGNERVLRARLADGKFFYFDDAKLNLEDRRENLAKLTYQEGLGSYLDKTERMTRLAGKMAELGVARGAEATDLKRACALLKLDLVTGLVRELPELQGFVGSWYASKSAAKASASGQTSAGESPAVVRAIASHYSPRGSHDSIPADTIGQMAGLIDKLDHIVGLFAIGKKPTGSSDPYALRRSAQGLVDILFDGLGDRQVDVEALIKFLLSEYSLANHSGNGEAVEREVLDFLEQRLKGKLLDLNYSREVTDCALSCGALSDIASLKVRLAVLDDLLADPKYQGLIRMGVRVGNILKSDSGDKVIEDKLSEPEEKALWQAFKEKVKLDEGVKLSSKADFQSMLAMLGELSGPVDAFFDKILVNDQDPVKKANRHGILKNIDKWLKRLGDFTKLQSLIN